MELRRRQVELPGRPLLPQIKNVHQQQRHLFRRRQVSRQAGQTDRQPVSALPDRSDRPVRFFRGTLFSCAGFCPRRQMVIAGGCASRPPRKRLKRALLVYVHGEQSPTIRPSVSRDLSVMSGAMPESPSAPPENACAAGAARWAGFAPVRDKPRSPAARVNPRLSFDFGISRGKKPDEFFVWNRMGPPVRLEFESIFWQRLPWVLAQTFVRKTA